MPCGKYEASCVVPDDANSRTSIEGGRHAQYRCVRSPRAGLFRRVRPHPPYFSTYLANASESMALAYSSASSILSKPAPLTFTSIRERITILISPSLSSLLNF